LIVIARSAEVLTQPRAPYDHHQAIPLEIVEEGMVEKMNHGSVCAAFRHARQLEGFFQPERDEVVYGAVHGFAPNSMELGLCRA
jgi:hypothetical protein